MSVGETVSHGASPANTADVALCREIWLLTLGSVAPEAEQMLARNECYFALLSLLEEVCGRPLDRWRIAFADNGSAYCSTVWITDKSGHSRVYEGRHDTSMLRSILAIIDQAKNDAA